VAISDIAAGSRGGGGRSHTAQSVTLPLHFDGDFPVIIVRINGHKVSTERRELRSLALIGRPGTASRSLDRRSITVERGGEKPTEKSTQGAGVASTFRAHLPMIATN
jgi:hypothetical protein